MECYNTIVPAKFENVTSIKKQITKKGLMPKHIIIDGSKFPIQPKDIHIGKGFEHFSDAFDNMETEASAYYVVRLCQKLGGWIPFTLEQIEEVYREAGHKGFTFNRLVESEAVLAHPAEVFGQIAEHASLCRNMNPVMASLSYAMSHGKAETVDKGGGWIVMGTDNKYNVTDDFVTRCFKSSPARRNMQAVEVSS